MSSLLNSSSLVWWPLLFSRLRSISRTVSSPPLYWYLLCMNNIFIGRGLWLLDFSLVDGPGGQTEDQPVGAGEYRRLQGRVEGGYDGDGKEAPEDEYPVIRI